MDPIGIVNLALITVGSEKINSLSDATKSARLASTLYEQARNEVFDLPESWKFATSRATLAALSTAPAFGYDYQYILPSACRRVIAFVDADGDEIEYKYRREVADVIEGAAEVEYDVILVNESSCRIKYIRLRIDPAKWPAWFTKLVYLNLAMMLCEPLKGDKSKKAQIRQEMWVDAYQSAVTANAMEDVDVNSAGVPTDYGNTDVLDAAGESDIQTDYVVSD
jgi:hypothetical protein